MTRCSYLPPEAISVIATAEARGGTTEGDIRAIRDRMGCKAEATRIIGKSSTEVDSLSCDDHVGHLLGDAPCAWVESIADRPIAVTATHRWVTGPALAIPAGTRIVDFGTNPTREALEAQGFCMDSPECRKALAVFVLTPEDISATDPESAPRTLNASIADVGTSWPSACAPNWTATASSPTTLKASGGTGGNGFRRMDLTGDVGGTGGALGGSGHSHVVAGTYRDVVIGGCTCAASGICSHCRAFSASRTNGTACLANAVRRTMARLMADRDAIPANGDGYHMVQVELAKTLGVPPDAVTIDAQPPGFRVTWNGVGAIWPEAHAPNKGTP